MPLINIKILHNIQNFFKNLYHRELLETFVSECVKRVAIKEEEEEEGEGEEKMESLKSSVATLAQSLDTK